MTPVPTGPSHFDRTIDSDTQRETGDQADLCQEMARL